MGAIGLIGGSLSGSACASFTLAVQILKDDWLLVRRSLAFGDIRALAKEYSDFPRFSAPVGLLFALSQHMPLLILAHFFGASAAGFYALGVRILQLPMTLVLNSFRKVFYQRISAVHNSGGNTYALFRQSTLGLLAIAVLPALSVVLFAPAIFSFVFGAHWQTAGEYARWLALWMTVLFAELPAVLLSRVHRKQGPLLVCRLVSFVFQCVSLVLGGLYLTILQTILLHSVVAAACHASVIAWMWISLRRLPVTAETT